MENQCKGCCGTCKYGIYNTVGAYVCINGDSKYVTAFVKYSHVCDKYEKNAEMSEAFLRRIIGEGIPPLFVKKVFEELIER